jgi:anti-sigma factor RsiW
MMNTEWHPTPEVLDRLRAGFFDDEPETKTRIREHLATCPACRQQADLWSQATAQLDAQTHGDPALSRALAERRRRVLAMGRESAVTRITPGRMAAAAAVLAVAVGIGVVTQLHHGRPVANVAQLQRSADTNPDFYSEIDFYVWLGDQKLGHGPQRRHET